MNKPNLLVIVGETATGKSALALAVAEQLNGEIICADSRTVYSGLDIGTAKPSAEDRVRIRHYGLDLVWPDQPFTVADFKSYAEQSIIEIASKGKLPIMVGGSGLYIDSVLYDYHFLPSPDAGLRERLNCLNLSQLHELITQMGLELPSDPLNPRRLIRLIETNGELPKKGLLRSNTAIVGLAISQDILRQRIAERLDVMLAAGLAAEAARMAAVYGWDALGLQSPGYKEFRGYSPFCRSDEHQVRQDIIKSTVALAKRQRTWFKRNKSIRWLTTDDKRLEAVDFATTTLNT